MQELISIIDQITKYGLRQVEEIEHKKLDLERWLVALYLKSFARSSAFDEQKFKDFDKSDYPQVAKNIRQNFPDLGWYHVILNSPKVMEKAELAMGDSEDDLVDIVYDLLEVRWRYIKNSPADALWYFEFIFSAHTKDHLIGLLTYFNEMKS